MKPSRAPLLAWCSTVAVSLWLAACGPGVGGTGTDTLADALDAWGAQAAAVCASPVAASVGCGSAGTAASPGPARYVEPGGTRAVLATYVGDAATLEDRCAGTRFEGLWGRTGASEGRYYGLFGPRDGERQAAALRVQPQTDGTQRVELRDLRERLLLGPVSLESSPVLAPDPRCP